MKTLETFLLISACFLVLAMVSRTLFIKKGHQANKPFLVYGLPLLLAVVIGIAHQLVTPSEDSTVWGPGVAEQHIVLSEGSDFSYQRALVLTPSMLPIPSLTGKLSAVAPKGARLQVQRTSPTSMEVWATTMGGNDRLLPACGNPRAMGMELRFDAALPLCSEK